MMEDSAILVVLSARLKQCFQPLEKNSSAIWQRCEDIIAHAGYDSTMADKMKAVIGKALRKAFGSELRWKKYRRHDGSRRNRYNLLPINPYPDIKPPPITYGIMGGYAKSSSERSKEDAGEMHNACHSLSIAQPTVQMGAGKNSGKIDSSSSGDSSITKGSSISEGKNNSRNIKELNNWRPFPNAFAIECVDFSAPFGENCDNIVAGPSQSHDEATNPGRYIQQHYSRNDTEQKLLLEDSGNHACTSKSNNRTSSIYTLDSNQARQKSHILNQGSFTGYNKQDDNVGALEYEQESTSYDEEMVEGMRRLAARHASEMNAYKQKMGRRTISKIPAHATIRHIPQDPSYYIENESLGSGFASEFIKPSPKTSFLDAGSRHRFPVTNDLNNAIDLSASNGRAAHAETNINHSQYSDHAPYHYIPHRRLYYFKDNNNTEHKPQSWAESTRTSLQSQSPRYR
ncbi:hypothetical protein SARC_12945 [Sphaeroforma arctica JP610]|uniref:Uncharacterized protein n=1 Tax=Sphaeroforma arctica JP610 TaxID=667725 RepID=A0A0L0FCL2_9EUKA|nr:hypothetical protein SARC_12945 [Sphaeroforma arctica JP610]KNC74512.1 hypothetical protein SARC_12945 [Sphaeroforma arctica JP610]|eukprot:XP_014148414.1 hypothetical protein SARC_12945 [Sphaeroforma arctica JP610]